VAGALPQTPLGALIVLPQVLAVFKGSASQHRRNGRVDTAEGKAMEGEGRKRMETREGMDRKRKESAYWSSSAGDHGSRKQP